MKKNQRISEYFKGSWYWTIRIFEVMKILFLTPNAKSLRLTLCLDSQLESKSKFVLIFGWKVANKMLKWNTNREICSRFSCGNSAESSFSLVFWRTNFLMPQPDPLLDCLRHLHTFTTGRTKHFKQDRVWDKRRNSLVRSKDRN